MIIMYTCTIARGQWQLGSLSHAVNSEASGYIPLADFPEQPPDTSVRDVEEDSFWAKKIDSDKKKDFYSTSDDDENGSDTGSEFYSSISGTEESESEEESSSHDDDSSSHDESPDDGSTSEDEDALENLQKRFGVVVPIKKHPIMVIRAL